MRASLLACGLGMVVTMSCAEQEGDLASRTQWIVDGELDSTPQVVLVYNRRRGSMCTGSIIAPRVVLTAKHCVQTDNAAEPDAPSSFNIGIGDSLRSLTRNFRAVELSTTPGTYDSRLRGLIGQDIALLTLNTGITDIEPFAIFRGEARDLVGREVVAIGYGQTPSGRSGTKYRVSGRVRYIDGNVLYTGPITCQGDSGGPILDAETNEIVGITSFGSGGCGAGGTAGANRVDSFSEMIDSVVGGSGSCLNDGEERCDGFDNDCDELIDETCLALGSECESSDECLGNNCLETPAGQRCTEECDPLRPELSCSTGLYCARVSGCEGLCVPLPEDRGEPAGNGADCEEDLDCMSLFCADPGDGHRRCLSACRGDDGICLAGEVCAAVAGECGGCVDAAIVRGARGLGEPCDEADECGSGQCHAEAGLSYCTRECESDSDCASSDRFHCREGICIHGALGGIGDSCLDNGDCGESAFCAFRGDVSWCTTFCDSEECPDGFECQEISGTELCVPTVGVLGDMCEGPDDCISGVCEEGVCSRICGRDAACTGGFECRRSDDGTSASCVAPEPEEEASSGCSASELGHRGQLAWLIMLFSLLLWRLGGGRQGFSRGALAGIVVGCVALAACTTSKEPSSASGEERITFELPDAGPMMDDQAEAEPEPERIEIGIACMSDEDCEVFCATDAEGFRDGYCTSFCSDDEPCQDGSSCVRINREQTLCLDICDPSSEERQCRAGYGCASGPQLEYPVCIPGCTDDTDCDEGRTCNPEGGGACFNPEAEWGDACADFDDCPDLGFCYAEGFRGWPGGMCIAFGCDPSTADGGCPSGTVCIEGGRSGFGRCLPGCEDDAECRDGYACGAPESAPERLHCQPACSSDDQCTFGRRCSSEGTCA